MPNYDSTSRQPFKEGGRVGFKHGGVHGKKGTFQKIGEAISRKYRGKAKTKVKGIEQDVKTGYLTHKAPKDRLDTQAGRKYLHEVARWKHGYPSPKRPKQPKNEQTYAQLKKKKKVVAKEKKRKVDWEKKYVKKDK